MTASLRIENDRQSVLRVRSNPALNGRAMPTLIGAARPPDFAASQLVLVGLAAGLVAGCDRSSAPTVEKAPAIVAAAPAEKPPQTDPALRKFASRFMAFHEELTSGIRLLTKNTSSDTWRRKAEAIDDLESRIPSPPPGYEGVRDECAKAWKILRLKVLLAAEERAEFFPSDSSVGELHEAAAIGKARLAALEILDPLAASPKFLELERLSAAENR